MLIKPYGDTLNDGSIQLSFTLPVKDGAKAREAARIYTQKLGFEHCEVVHSNPLSDDFTFFVVYGKTHLGIDYDQVIIEDTSDSDYMSMNEIDDYIEKNIKRKLVVIGACTGFDAHTVGIDAIMNMKGYNHHFGLERYRMIDAYNLGAQVTNEAFIDFAEKVKADVLLVSQIVTQKDTHVENLTNLIELLEAKKVRNKYIVIAGGPRLSHKLALELGYDAGFGRGTYAEHVATFAVKRFTERN